MTSGAAQRERLATAIEPAVTAAGYELEKVSVGPAGRRTVSPIRTTPRVVLPPGRGSSVMV